MKVSKSGFISKGILLAAAGIIIAFIPQIINMAFYIIGGIVIAACIITFISSLFSGEPGVMLPSSIGGILLGIIIIFLPKIISFGIAIIGGIVFSIMGITKLITAFNYNKPKNTRIFNGICGVLLMITAIILFVNPFGAASAARFIIGIVIILYSLFYFYAAYVASEREKNASPDIIDVTNFTIDDK